MKPPGFGTRRFVIGLVGVTLSGGASRREPRHRSWARRGGRHGDTMSPQCARCIVAPASIRLHPPLGQGRRLLRTARRHWFVFIKAKYITSTESLLPSLVPKTFILLVLVADPFYEEILIQLLQALPKNGYHGVAQ